MKSRTPIAVTALLALALAGCADDTADPAAGASRTPSSSATAPASSSAAPSASTSGSGQNIGDTLLIFTRQGGLAGTNDRLVVRPDGAWTLTTKSDSKQGKLTPTELTALKATLDQVGFSKLPANNSGGNVADGYKYTISYGGHEVAAEDGAVPTALQPAITTLNGLLSR